MGVGRLQDERHFRSFATALEQTIARYGDQDRATLYERQKCQVEALIVLEEAFRDRLIEHPDGRKVFGLFLQHIKQDKRNILAARPYFRERQTKFSEHIADAIKGGNPKALYSFHYNYMFMQFALRAWIWPEDEVLIDIAARALAVRTEIVVTNMPLAISRARVFFGRTPRSQLTYMDLIQIAAEGLLAAVDKFVPPFTKVFRSVAMGRMHGNFIDQYSETLLHFYPLDKRKIYRANKLVRKFIGGGNAESIDYDALAEAVNKDVPGELHRTTGPEIASLLAAASCVSVHSPFALDDEERCDAMARYMADPAQQPDAQLEAAEAMASLHTAFEKLTILEQKILRLRGITL